MSRLLRTVRYLRPRQVVFQLFYRLTGRLSSKGARTQVPAFPETVRRPPPLPVGAVGKAHQLPPRWAAPATFTFLNRTVDFGTVTGIDWNYADEGKLWTYNLNYFEFLRQPDLPPATGLALIGHWIDREATHQDGWEPYPLSLRLVNWGQFLRSLPGEIPAPVLQSIYRQYDSLWSKIEYHLDGNHLLENTLALAYTARLLCLPGGVQKADRLLLRELEAQYLSDGAHYELSPTYQLVLLWRQLDLLSLVSEKPAPASAPLFPVLRGSIARQLGWCNAFVSSHSGRYPHFNDSAPGIAPSLPAVFDYAGSLEVFPAPVVLGDCGYRHWTTGRTDLWIDAAAIGPDHIPGHAHADNLSFELHLDGVPTIVDPAISTYEKNARRHWERSTAAHNTVTVADRDSSETWGGFRVGRRARTTIVGEVAGLSLIARHDGYPGGHQRIFTLDGNLLTITDCVTGPATARFHFDYRSDPILESEELSCGALRMTWNGKHARLTHYEQAVGWNELRPARCLEIGFINDLVTEITFSHTST